MYHATVVVHNCFGREELTSARAPGTGREQNRKEPLDHSGSLAVDDLLDGECDVSSRA
jgi:hypothetical protein